MAYDEDLAARIRSILGGRKDVTERKMFGGLAFLLNGNMCCGVLKNRLIVRLGPENSARALQEPHTRPFDFTGRPMKTMVYVMPRGTESDEDLREWVRRGVRFASRLPPKTSTNT